MHDMLLVLCMYVFLWYGRLRYGWLPSGLPAKCVCGHGFTVDHAMNCSSGGFPSLCHNELRHFTAAALSEVCHDVGIDPASYLVNLFIMP